ncbi:MAG TPA: YCF48-related protein [Blastocatellia bacterium]|nr:YCF48-related protein [Blastocatellia bacterium]
MKGRYLILVTLLSISISLFVVKADDNPRDVLTSTSTTTKEVRQWEITGPWGGDVRAMVAAPGDSDLLYIGTSDGQIFRSTDGAKSWRRLKPGLERRGLSVDSLVIDSHDNRIMYAGVWAVARDEEGGIFKSEDGGEHWKLLEGTRKLSVRSVALAPSDPDFILAGSANDDPKLNGVFRSTDAGKNWERISPVGDKEIRNIESIAISPRDTDTIYIGTWHLPWKTTDGGVSWKQTGYKAVGMIDDSDIFGINVDPVNPNLVYINACSGIYRSTSAGEKWAKIPGIPFSARRTYTLLPHPANPNVIFAGTSEGLWRSKDGGKRWMLLTSKSVVIRSIIVTPDKPGRVLIATDDFGVRISDNLGDDFADTNTGFIHRHVLAIMPDATERGRLLASVFHDGTAGSVFASSDAGESWQASTRGLGSRDVFAFHQMPDNPSVIYAGTNTGVFRSNDRGASWSFVGKEQEQPQKPAKKSRKPGRKARASFTIPGESLPPAATGRYEAVPVAMRSTLTAGQKSKAKASKAKAKKPTPKRAAKKEQPIADAVTPLTPGLIELNKQVDDITSFVDSEGRRGLLAATMDGLYRTVDEVKGWEKVNISGYDSNGRVYSVSTHKDTPKRIYIGTKQGLFISDDGGATWEHVDRGPSDMSVKAIAQDPRDGQTVLLGTNQYIFRSTNAGRTWVRRGGGLPSGDFTSVVINPSNPDEVIVAEYSKGGVYRSTDKGYSWERIDSIVGAELPTNRVWTLTFDPFDRDRVYAGSFSSGVYVLTFQRGATNSSH